MPGVDDDVAEVLVILVATGGDDGGRAVLGRSPDTCLRGAVNASLRERLPIDEAGAYGHAPGMAEQSVWHISMEGERCGGVKRASLLVRVGVSPAPKPSVLVVAGVRGSTSTGTR